MAIMEVKKASEQKVFIAGVIDFAILFALVFITIKVLKIKSVDKNELVNIAKLVVTAYFVLVMQVIPNFIFSQSMGKFLLKIKIVKKESFDRLSFFESIIHSLLLSLNTNQTILDIRDEDE